MVNLESMLSNMVLSGVGLDRLSSTCFDFWVMWCRCALG